MLCPEDQCWGRSPTFSANDVETFLSPPHPAHCFATLREGLAFRNVYQSAGSGSCGVHRVGNLLHHGTHQAPSVFAENHDRQFAALQILLVRQICVGREKHFKPSFLGRFQQVTLLNVSHRSALASLTIWPCSAREMPLGVPWSRTMCINGESELPDSVLQSPVPQ
jgi:hypothetical protein